MLTDTDVADLVALRTWLRATPTAGDPDRLAALRAREEALSPAARDAWQHWPAAQLAAELDRWKPAFLVQKTAAGFRAYRWITRRRAYALRACATRLSAQEAEAFKAELVRT